jgi:CRP/FNR family transcriptional regulator, cyclic AMP receptor protein
VIATYEPLSLVNSVGLTKVHGYTVKKGISVGIVRSVRSGSRYKEINDYTAHGICRLLENSLAMITPSARQAFLETIPIFAGLNADAVSEIALAAEESEFQAGQIIVREDEPGNRMFIIHSGRVQVVKHLGQPRETVLATFGPRDFLGEMSIIECVARAASLRTIEDSFLFALKSTDLYHLFRHQPDQYAIVILNIARDLSRRLRAIDEMFTAVSH